MKDFSNYLTQVEFYKRIAAKVSNMKIEDPTTIYLTKHKLLEGIRKIDLPKDVFVKEQEYVAGQFQLVTDALKKMGITIKK